MGTRRTRKGEPARPRNARGEGDRLRDEIIDASIKVLAVLAPDEPFSLRAVAREAKIAAPSIYIHFTNMNALLQAVLQKLLKEQVAIRADAEEKAALAGGGAWERLLARSMAAVAFGLKHPGHYKVLYEGRVVPRLNNPRLEEFSRPAQVRAVELIREIPVAKGARRVCDDPHRLALLLWCGLHGIISLRINKPTLPWPDTTELVEQMTRAIIQPR